MIRRRTAPMLGLRWQEHKSWCCACCSRRTLALSTVLTLYSVRAPQVSRSTDVVEGQLRHLLHSRCVRRRGLVQVASCTATSMSTRSTTSSCGGDVLMRWRRTCPYLAPCGGGSVRDCTRPIELAAWLLRRPYGGAWEVSGGGLCGRRHTAQRAAWSAPLPDSTTPCFAGLAYAIEWSVCGAPRTVYELGRLWPNSGQRL